MFRKRLFVFFLVCAVTLCGGIPTWGDTTQEQIDQAQSQKAATQSSLNQAEDQINTLQGQKAHMEAYLEELNGQYLELNGQVEDLEAQAADKEKELEGTRTQLRAAARKADEQYEDMKLRIAYMYESGNSAFFNAVFSAGSIGEMLTRAENIRQISDYDRQRLKEYEETKQEIEEKEFQIEKEQKEIQRLQAESQEKQQEVRELVDSTNSSILSYAQQISSSQAEAQALVEELTSQEENLNELLRAQAAEQEAEEKAREEAQAAAEAAQSAQEGQESGGENDAGASTDAEEGSSAEDVSAEEETAGAEDIEDEENASGGEDSQEGASGGTYLGNFKLTAYCNCAQCCGTAGNLTASGTWPAAGRTVAMGGIDFGTRLSINGTVYTVEDRGTPYGHVDIFFNNHQDALNFGLQYADVYRVD